MSTQELEFFFSPFSRLRFSEDEAVLAFGFEDQEDPELAEHFPELEGRRKSIDKILKKGDDVVALHGILRDEKVIQAGLIYIQYPWRKKKEISVGGINFLQQVSIRTAYAVRRAREEQFTNLAIVLPNRFSPQNVKDEAQRKHLYSFIRAVSESVVCANNSFDDFLNSAAPAKIKEVTFMFFGEPDLALDGFFRKAIGDGRIIGRRVSEAKRMTEIPPNLQTTTAFVAEIIGKQLARKVPNAWEKITVSPQITATVLRGASALKAQGFELIAAVGGGNEHPPCLLKLHYKPKTARQKRIKKIVLTGKGVVFDSGGYDIKGTGYFDNMHYDMAGAATAIAVLRLAEDFNLPVELIAVLPIVQSLIGPKALLPGSILTAYGGKTVEIINTDCEGRLLMGEAIAFGEKKFSPDAMITIGTLGDLSDFGQDFLKVSIVGKGLERKARIAEKLAAEKMVLLPPIEHFNRVNEAHAGTKSDLVNDVYKCYHTSPFVFMYNFFETEPTWVFVDISAVFESGAETYGAGPGFGLKFVWHILQQFT